MNSKKPLFKSRVGQALAVYIGSTWVFVEALGFLISNYNWDPVLLDIVILLMVFGVPTTLIYASFSGRWNKKAILLHAINGLLSILVLGFFIMNPHRMRPDKLRVAKLSGYEKIALPGLNSVAVLPFTNYISDKKEDEYLLAGMHDGLITEIGKLGSIRTISRTSTLEYAQQKKKLKKIAKELGVESIIEGTLVRIDTLIEWRLKLIRVFPQEELLWSHEFSTSLAEIPNLYKTVTKQVALQINQQLTPKENQSLSLSEKVDPKAYDAFLKGHYYGGYLTRDGLERSIEFYEKAISIDSNFYLAYNGLAQAWIAMKQVNLVSPMEADPKVLKHFKRAQELNPNAAPNWALKAAIEVWTDYKWEEALKSFEKSIALDPNNPSTRLIYAHTLMILNRWEEAWEQMTYAETIDPNNPWTIGFKAMMFLNEKKFLSASKNMEKLKALVPDHPFAGLYTMMKNNNTFKKDAAVEEMKKLLTNTIPLASLGPFIEDSFAKNQDFKQTIRETLNFLEQQDGSIYLPPFLMFQFYKPILQDDAKSLYWMERMYQERNPNLPYLGIQGSDLIIDHPRAESILKEIGLR